MPFNSLEHTSTRVFGLSWSSQRPELTVSAVDPLAMRRECLQDNVENGEDDGIGAELTRSIRGLAHAVVLFLASCVSVGSMACLTQYA